MFPPVELSLFGFEVRVHWSFLIPTAIYGWKLKETGHPFWMLVTFAIVLAVSVLVHEFGHAFALRRFGSTCPVISIHALGGHVKWCEICERSMTPGWKLVIALAGPLTGLVLAAISYVAMLSAADVVVFVVAAQFFTVNLAMNLLNLFPIMPLDGGHAALSLLKLPLPQRLHWVPAVAVSLASMFAAGWMVIKGYDTQEAFILLYGIQFYIVNLVLIQAVLRPNPDSS